MREKKYKANLSIELHILKALLFQQAKAILFASADDVHFTTHSQKNVHYN
jgi:hypothetical protein